MRSATASLLVLFGLVVNAFGSPQAPADVARVDNVRSSQLSGGVIEVTYDLIDTGRPARYAISLEASDDGGRTWNIHPRSVTGDVGPNVAAGSGKRIVWRAGQDIETVPTDHFQYRIIPALLAAPHPDEPEPERQSPTLGTRHIRGFGGYAYLSQNNISDPSYPRGWFVGGDVAIKKWLGIVGELDGHHQTQNPGSTFQLTRHWYLFGAGPRFTRPLPNQPVALFGEMLFGSGQLRSVSRFNDDTIRYFAIRPVGGADIRVLNCCDIRVAVGETFMDDFIFKEFHFNTGVVLNIGGR